MKIEQQVCSLEWAKRLKKLKVPQFSIFTWRDEGDKYNLTSEHCDFDATITTEKGERKVKDYSAFTVAELGEMLPPSIGGNNFAVYQIDGHWHITYSTSKNWWVRQIAETEADARAKMLVYLLENKLITL